MGQLLKLPTYSEGAALELVRTIIPNHYPEILVGMRDARMAKGLSVITPALRNLILSDMILCSPRRAYTLFLRLNSGSTFPIPDDVQKRTAALLKIVSQGDPAMDDVECNDYGPKKYALYWDYFDQQPVLNIPSPFGDFV
jgi:hypothetical protein